MADETELTPTSVEETPAPAVEDAPASAPTPEPAPSAPPEPDLPAFSLDFSDTQAPDAPSDTPPPPKITDEDIARYLASKEHDDLKHIPAYNKTVQKSISKYRQEQERRAQENYQLAQWNNYFASLPPERLLAEREDPQRDAIYARVRQWRQAGAPTGGISQTKVVEDMISGLHRYFSTDERFAKVVEDWDEYQDISDPGEFLQRVISQGLKKREKELEKHAEMKAKAYIKDALAKRGIEMPVPVTQSTSAQGAPGGLTYESYISMTPEQVSKFSPREIDDMLARHRARS